MNIISESSTIDTWVTPAGELVTTKYEDGFGHVDYCLDRTGAGEVVAVMCNPCGRKVRTSTRSNIDVIFPNLQRHCINVCCPHGQTFLPNADYDYNDNDSPSYVALFKLVFSLSNNFLC